jgi:hypothetical protein
MYEFAPSSRNFGIALFVVSAFANRDVVRSLDFSFSIPLFHHLVPIR